MGVTKPVEVKDQHGNAYELRRVRIEDLPDYLDREGLIAGGWLWFGGEGGDRVLLVRPDPATHAEV